MKALDVIQNGTGLYSFENGGVLLVWSARLLQGEPEPVLGNPLESVREPSFSEFKYKERGGSVVQNEARSPASPDFNLQNVEIIGRNQQRSINIGVTPVRPNSFVSFDVVQGYLKENPLLNQLKITSLGDTTLEPFLVDEQRYQGANWAIQKLSELFDGTLIKLDRIQQFRIDGSTQILWAHLVHHFGSDGAAGLVQSFIQTEYRALKADFQRFEGEVKRDVEQWKAYGGLPLVDQSQAVSLELTAVNLGTTLVALHGLLTLLSVATSFVQGVDEVVRRMNALKTQTSQTGEIELS